jgi:hypothetical protein
MHTALVSDAAAAASGWVARGPSAAPTGFALGAPNPDPLVVAAAAVLVLSCRRVVEAGGRGTLVVRRPFWRRMPCGCGGGGTNASST